jgi:nucleoside-diphosphate-sugar epimerase
MGKKVKILITGSSGFIGTHLVEIALQQQFEIYAMVRKSSTQGKFS